MKWIAIAAFLVLGIVLGMILAIALLAYASIGEDGIKIGNTVYWKEKETPTKDEWRMM